LFTQKRFLNALDLMTANPLSLRSGETVKEAKAFLLDHSFSAAPVVNEAGRPIGVLSLSDIVRAESEGVTYLEREKFESANRKLSTGERVGEGYEIEKVPTVTIDEIMTPLVFTIHASTSVPNVIVELLDRKIHRLFVTDSEGTLIGVITTLDILRALKSSTF